MIVDRRMGYRLYPVMSGERADPVASLLRFGLKGLSTAYYLGYRRRMGRFKKRKADRIGVPVISVGNITLGGAGKTPVCRYLATKMSGRGRKVGIATRGYGREGAGAVALERGRGVKSWHACGDEPLLFLNDPAVSAVAVDVNRTRAARELAERLGCGAVILDDGFQFITLERDLDIVVIDAGNPFGFDRLFPAGLLREPVRELRRADLLWIAKCDSVSAAEKAETRARLDREFPGIPVVESRYEPSSLYFADNPGEKVPIDEIKGKKVLCMSGIGNPEAFEKTVERIAGCEKIAFRFPDHHPFGDGELRKVEDAALKSGAEYIVTTEKDAVRLPGHFKARRRWLVLRVEVVVTAGGEKLDSMLFLL